MEKLFNEISIVYKDEWKALDTMSKLDNIQS